jgi:hypothetical protein
MGGLVNTIFVVLSGGLTLFVTEYQTVVGMGWEMAAPAGSVLAELHGAFALGRRGY